MSDEARVRVWRGPGWAVVALYGDVDVTLEATFERARRVVAGWGCPVDVTCPR